MDLFFSVSNESNCYYSLPSKLILALFIFSIMISKLLGLIFFGIQIDLNFLILMWFLVALSLINSCVVSLLVSYFLDS